MRGPCQAILNSLSHSGGGTGNDTIQFSASIDGGIINLKSFVNDVSVGSTIAGPSALFINNNDTLVIDGQTGLTQGITIERDTNPADYAGGQVPNFRLFDVDTGSSLTLQSLTLSGGKAQGFAGGNAYFGAAGGGSAGLGGAIFNQGSLMILNSTLTGNTAQGGAGGVNGDSAQGKYGGAGGAGLGAVGASSSYNYGGSGGGPNPGAGGKFAHAATGNGFGGGGGGGANTAPTYGYAGAAGGFGGGGGGSGAGDNPRIGGGPGGFGGGAGGTFAAINPASGGYGGGNGGQKGLGGGGAGMGGAVFNNEGGTVLISNSTITGNTASGGNRGQNGSQAYGATAGKGLGGGLFNRNGTIMVTNSTLSANTVTNGDGSSGNGRDVFNLSDGANKKGTANITNCILGQSGSTTIADFASANNGGISPDNTGSNNLMSNRGTFSLGGVITATDPLLGPLQSNGGPTKTMALQAGSLAIDAGIQAGAPTKDQRGWLRDSAPDIGAYEVRIVANMIVNTAGDATASDNFLSLREAINLVTGGGVAYSALSPAEKNLVTPVAGTVSTITFASSVDGQTIRLSKFVNDVSAGSTMAGPSAFFIDHMTLVIDGQTGLSQGITITRDTNPADYAGEQVPSFRLFDVPVGSGLTLQGLTLSSGKAQGFAGGSGSWSGAGGGSGGLGGAIFNQGSLTILNSTLSGNTAQGGAGGSFQSGPSNLYGGAGGAGLGAVGGAVTANNGSAGGGPNGGGGGTSGSVGTAGAAGGFGGGGGGGGQGSSTGGAGGTGGFGAGGGGGGYFAGDGGGGGFGGGGGGSSGNGTFAGVPGYGGGYGAAGNTSGGRSAGGGGGGLGGAVFNEAGTVTITNSTITGNTASGGAAGTAPDGNGTAGKGMGGALFNHNGTISVLNSTISGNAAADGGRGFFNLGERYENTTTSTSAIATISNSIIGQSNTTVSDLVIRRIGPPGTSLSTVSGGTNLIRTITTIAGANNLTGTLTTDPKLGALANNGGLTQTMALLAGSPAIDAGNNALVTAPPFAGPPFTDQRGALYARVVDGNGDSLAQVDIGAYEVGLLLGDFNRDKQRTVADVSAAMAALADLNKYQSTNSLFGADLLAVADINRDGAVTNADLQALLVLLANSPGGGAGSIATGAAASQGTTATAPATDTAITDADIQGLINPLAGAGGSGSVSMTSCAAQRRTRLRQLQQSPATSNRAPARIPRGLRPSMLNCPTERKPFRDNRQNRDSILHFRPKHHSLLT